MARYQQNDYFAVHRTWEDYVGLVLGIVVVLSPWLVGQTTHSGALTTATSIGVFLMIVAGLEILRLRRWHEVATLVLGFSLFLAPFMLDYAQGPLGAIHIALGSVISVLAILEIWQDWNLSDDQLGQHGG